MAYQKKDRLLERYLQYLEVERNASPRTVITYRHALAKFKHFGDDKISWVECTAQQFRGFLLDCMKSGMARSYVRLTFAEQVQVGPVDDHDPLHASARVTARRTSGDGTA